LVIYVADSGNNVIRMLNAAGTITTVAGNGTRGDAGDNGPATSAELDAYGVALDSAGNLYVTQEAFPTAVRQVNTSASALNFGNTCAGSTNTQTAAVTNIGNAPITFATLPPVKIRASPPGSRKTVAVAVLN
jgi:hypothetical protein